MFEDISTAIVKFFNGPVIYLSVGDRTLSPDLINFISKFNDIKITSRCHGYRFRDCYLMTYDDKETGYNDVIIQECFFNGELIKVFALPLYAAIQEADEGVILSNIALLSVLLVCGSTNYHKTKTTLFKNMDYNIETVEKYAPIIIFANSVLAIMGDKFNPSKLYNIFYYLKSVALTEHKNGIKDLSLFDHRFNTFFEISKPDFCKLYELLKSEERLLPSLKIPVFKNVSFPILYELLDCSQIVKYLEESE